MRQAAVWRTIEVMTTKTFQEFFSENLSEFGWSLSDSDIPDWTTYSDAMVRIGQWWDSIDSHSRDIFRTADFSEGLNEQGYFSTFPALYTLLAGNPMGTFDKTFNDVIACGRRAHLQVDEQVEEVSNVLEVVS
jgi:hypothetical protein